MSNTHPVSGYEPEWDEDLQLGLRAAETARAQLRDDLIRTGRSAPDVSVCLNDGLVWVEIAGAADGGIPDAAPFEVMVAEMAERIRDLLMEQDWATFWPTCVTHARGLHIQIRDAQGIWWCSAGAGHACGGIGSLDPTSVR